MTRGPEDETNRNMIIAIVLSLLIFLPYQYFVLEPMQRQQKAAIMADRAAKGLPPTGSTQKGAPGEGSASPAAPESALPRSPRRAPRPIASLLRSKTGGR